MPYAATGTTAHAVVPVAVERMQPRRLDGAPSGVKVSCRT